MYYHLAQNNFSLLGRVERASTVHGVVINTTNISLQLAMQHVYAHIAAPLSNWEQRQKIYNATVANRVAMFEVYYT